MSKRLRILHEEGYQWTDTTAYIRSLFTNVLSDALKFMRSEYRIDGIVHGGISSYFQKNVFEKSCQKSELSVFSPFVFVSVSMSQNLPVLKSLVTKSIF
jgi:diphthamide synthase (EF-2-diphthine--ammonia ligase)